MLLRPSSVVSLSAIAINLVTRAERAGQILTLRSCRPRSLSSELSAPDDAEDSPSHLRDGKRRGHVLHTPQTRPTAYIVLYRT